MSRIICALTLTLVLTGCSNTMMSPIADLTSSRELDSHFDTGGEKAFVFDPSIGKWAAYDATGTMVRSGKASGGADFCPDLGEPCRTEVGTFRIQVKKGEDCESNTFPIGEGGAWMPYCMFFHKGSAIHGSGLVPDQNSSHGCIRVLPEVAKWLNEDFLDVGSKVIVRPYSTELHNIDGPNNGDLGKYRALRADSESPWSKLLPVGLW